ncbi:Mitochondrial inner membrane protease subunit 2 [Taphrina deformans PYCC 5710]|uniref:Mitochondrial inner membrane protease subunit 2 n=1 Tax=Taphrina deformans (strain PYCC 5710 / ATCC 11124 / CBS 356.35 / IMI 108563 / JCM 9778 / NBRC 8474) TaxID=1097556 RepID=R4XB28_TAPDE|nr:Mitochondrial inner membrane protease subunit 2 [Taphrina deformans PYCC 5710]|eukprot:CCG82795.1 Mitochondrial inner membrane protease subunit 2 [Taphrina deformans PYCC 5710]
MSNARAFGRAVFRQSVIALTWVPVVIFVENNIFSVASIEGISMKPTFNPESNRLRRDWVLENKWFWWTGPEGEPLFHRGDVVTLRSPMTTRMATKRVVAVAGDIISTRPPRAGRVVTVPEGHVWVEGDEQFHSSDSNDYGPVAINLIESKISTIIWPLSRFGEVSKEGGRDPRISKRQMNTEGNAGDWAEYGYH